MRSLLFLEPLNHYRLAAVWQRVRRGGQAGFVDVDLSATDFP